jgi:amidohydrolase
METHRFSFMDTIKYEKFRQDLHKIPEIGFEEFETKKYLLDYLKSLKIFEKEIGAKLNEIKETGFFIDIQGKGEKNSEVNSLIAYRTDIDGLPIEEETGVSYTSIHKGFQHACGHDGHMSILTAFLEFYCQNLQKIPSNITIRFLYQPAEEGRGGAEMMIENGCLNNVEEIYGLHNATLFNVGEIGCCSGTIMSRIDTFEIQIIGRGGHGSTPHLCSNPIQIGTNIINALHQITSQEIDSKDRCVLTVGQFTSGSTFNVIPETGKIQGTCRTITPNTADKIRKRIQEISEGFAKIYNSDVKVTFTTPGDLTINYEKQTKLVEKVANKYFTLKNNDLPLMASEDFSFYVKKIPGCFFILGCGDKDHHRYLHTSYYDFNDKAIPIGVEMYIRILEEKFNLKLLD